MKKIIYLSFLLVFGISFSQNEASHKNDSCESGTAQAKTDFDNGKYNCYSYGLIFDTNPDLSDYILKYRIKKYGINTKNVGCVITGFSKCYSKTMEELVLKKFGNDIFEKSSKEAEELYTKEKK